MTQQNIVVFPIFQHDFYTILLSFQFVGINGRNSGHVILHRFARSRRNRAAAYSRRLRARGYSDVDAAHMAVTKSVNIINNNKIVCIAETINNN